MKVNYVIGASAHRVNRDPAGGVVGKDHLRWHLEALSEINTEDLAQVTIVRATPLDRGPGSDEYWDVTEAASKLKCPVVNLDVPDMWFCYSSWLHAGMEYRNEFDYYVLAEDDYYLALKDAVPVLIDIHTRKLPDGGHLCGYFRDHAAVGSGIVDGPTFIKAIDQYENPLQELNPGAQRYFSYAFFPDKTADYVDEYRCLFNSNQIIELYRDPSLGLTRDIFRPIQYLVTGEQDFARQQNT